MTPVITQQKRQPLLLSSIRKFFLQVLETQPVFLYHNPIIHLLMFSLVNLIIRQICMIGKRLRPLLFIFQLRAYTFFKNSVSAST